MNHRIWGIGSTIRMGMFVTFVGLFIANGSLAIAAAAKNVDKAGVILQGYDAVSYFKSATPLKGLPKFQTSFEGATYLFASEANKNEFLKSPKNYAPQFDGWCAYAVADSKSKVEIDPMNYIIQDGRLLLFYNGLWGDTKKKWQKEPAKFLKTADANWPETQRKDP